MAEVSLVVGNSDGGDGTDVGGAGRGGADCAVAHAHLLHRTVVVEEIIAVISDAQSGMGCLQELGLATGHETPTANGTAKTTPPRLLSESRRGYNVVKGNICGLLHLRSLIFVIHAGVPEADDIEDVALSEID